MELWMGQITELNRGDFTRRNIGDVTWEDIFQWIFYLMDINGILKDIHYIKNKRYVLLANILIF